MRRRVLAVGLLLALAGCGGSRTISAKEVSKLVLRPRDLGRPFTSFYSGPVTQLDTQGGPRADPRRYGREGGWVARYNRPGSARTAGPLVVESRVDVFKSGNGAKQDLAAYRKALGAGAAGRPRAVRFPRVGDESFGVTFVQAGAVPLRFYRLAWRYRNVTASVTAEGFERKLSQDDALELVRKQQSLLTHA